MNYQHLKVFVIIISIAKNVHKIQNVAGAKWKNNVFKEMKLDHSIFIAISMIIIYVEARLVQNIMIVK